MIRSLAVALVAALLYTGLGLAVSHVPPFGIDLAGRALAGHGTHVALIFTASCWWPALAVLGLFAVALAVRNPAWRGRVVLALPVTLITWQLSDFLKTVFGRPRPEYWQLIHEPSLSYSSGHAMFAVLVYGLWAWFVYHSAIAQPVRGAVAAVLGLWALGVLWSRLALGAHYITDLAGGILLAAAALAIADAIRQALAGATSPRA